MEGIALETSTLWTTCTAGGVENASTAGNGSSDSGEGSSCPAECWQVIAAAAKTRRSSPEIIIGMVAAAEEKDQEEPKGEEEERREGLILAWLGLLDFLALDLPTGGRVDGGFKGVA